MITQDEACEGLARLCAGEDCSALSPELLEELHVIGCVDHLGRLTEQGWHCYRGNVRAAEQRKHLLDHMEAHRAAQASG